MRKVGWSVAAFVILCGFYVFFAGEISTVEIIAAVVAAGVGTALGYAIGAVTEKTFRLAMPARAVLRPLAALLPETITVGSQLLRIALRGTDHQVGEFVRQPFDPGRDDAASATRRAVSVIGVSLAPRSFVVRGERSDHLLLHDLPAKPVSTDRAWPA